MGGSHSRDVAIPGDQVTFDHFEVLRAIGKGSFGKVCIVKKGNNSDKMYAMKYVRKLDCIAKGALRNVTREVEIISKLEHPFLVNLWFSFQDEEDLFMVTDLLLGGDLRYHIHQQVQFTEESVLLIIAEIALALDYLKSQKIIHRDIKPDNILLDVEGHAHVTDFNVATVLEDGQLATSISGTKPYIAPEIYMCSSSNETLRNGYSYSVDWWSLGILSWELLEGTRPYPIHSTTNYKEAFQILQDYKLNFPQDWSKSMIELVKHLVLFDPEVRLTTLEELKSKTAMKHLNFDDIYNKQVRPPFIPSALHLNFDPVLEAEELIMESRPLHKKKKRLAKQRSLISDQVVTSNPTHDYNKFIFIPEYPIYNREHELEQREREMKEKQWEIELQLAMAEAEKKLRVGNLNNRRSLNNQPLQNTSQLSVHSHSSRASTSLDIDFIDASPETSTNGFKI